MRSYGVNWFLVWLGLLLMFWPLYAWLKELIPFFDSSSHSATPTYGQAFAQAFGFTFVYYFGYSTTIAHPKALEKLRQDRAKKQNAPKRRQRWWFAWGILFAIILSASLISQLVFHHFSWLHLCIYSLLLPCSSLGCLWLTNKAVEKGQLERLLKNVDLT